jgi:hypothetical protein
VAHLTGGSLHIFQAFSGFGGILIQALSRPARQQVRTLLAGLDWAFARKAVKLQTVAWPPASVLSEHKSD